ncbi:MAG: glycosyltransferase family 2 protein [Lachnospiraceae bacterium]|nr:glycosyltransferase family 2 protein [Lachnospiraceae bacterium]MDE7204577.1 glycosyltransferase family 2 protein [Lachnospiraceae bacterium]
MDAYDRITNVIRDLDQYDYEILFADNASNDNSETILRDLANKDKHVKVIFNYRNYGPQRSGTNLCFRATGDAIIALPCDLQEPPEMIPEFVREWEKGNLIVWGQKTKSKEMPIKYFARSIYYKIIQNFSDYPQYEQTTGFGITDRSVYDKVKELNDPDMALRHLVAELGYPVKLIPYTQEQRKKGKSSYNIWRYFDFALDSLIRTSKVPLRLTTILGVICSVISFVMGIIYLIYKLICWDTFLAGMAPVVIAVFFLGSVQILTIGMIGEYVGVILTKVTKRPIVLEKECLNFDDNEEKDGKREN